MLRRLQTAIAGAFFGGTHDRNGEELEAIPHYRKALELGLSAGDRAGAMLGLGSSLRNVGQVDESLLILRRAVAEFPNDSALVAFLALSLHSAGQHTASVIQLLALVVQHVPLDGYDRALSFYLDELRAQESGPRA